MDTQIGGFSLVEENGVERLRKLGHREAVLFPDLRMLPPDLLHSAGFFEESRPTYHWDGQRWGGSELAMLLYTVSGRGRLQYGNRQLFVGPGQAMLVLFPHDHRYWIEDGEHWEFFYVTLTGGAAVRTIREIVAKVGPVVSLDGRSPALARALAACTAALESRIETPYRASEIARNIVSDLYAETVSAQDSLEGPNQAAPAFVFEVEQFCRRNLSRPIGVEDMARVARMSRYHFSRQFGRARGISPGRYLASLRLDEAKRLLAGGAHSVKEVAEQCGYGDANYFCKVFRRSFGMSPGTLRYASMDAS